MNEVTKFDAREAIKKLGMVCRVPDRSSVDDLSGIWVNVLKGVSDRELQSAVDAYLRDGSFRFPPPSEIRKLALGNRKPEAGAIPDTLHNRYLRWENDHEGPCPVCGANLEELSAKARGVPAVEWGEKGQKLVETPDEEPTGPYRAGVLHDARKHELAKVRAVGCTNERTSRPAAGLGEHRDRHLREALS